MPHSAGENKEFVRTFLEKIKPYTIVDIGAGAMMYGHLIRETIDAHITAIEIWKPYIDFYPYDRVYDNVINSDARNYNDYNVDLVIAGDVMEHMSEADMCALALKIRAQAKWLLISVPIIHYPQGHIENNPFEEHIQEDLNYDELKRILGPPDLYKNFLQTGTYIYKGKNN